MHLAHDPGADSLPAPAAGSERPASGEANRIAAHLSRLADDLSALQLIIEDTEKLIRQGWDVAVDLNQIRRNCRLCEAAGGLSEAIGFYQGLLNQCRYNVQAAASAVASIRAVADDCRWPGDNPDCAPAIRPRRYAGGVERRDMVCDGDSRAVAEKAVG